MVGLGVIGALVVVLTVGFGEMVGEGVAGELEEPGFGFVGFRVTMGAGEDVGAEGKAIEG
jgi:hypothetical protein